jgi:tRNA (adenine57-N1/adenine58-N1)-methyltransferase
MMLREGDLVYILDDQGRRHWLTLKHEMIKVPGLGVIDGSIVLQMESGGVLKIAGRAFVVLKPGIPELMDSLERGAQIITPKDAETIVFRLSLGCGQVVVEGGVGSGALTIALLNAVGEKGKVVSIEKREDFAKRARRNIERSGLSGRWELLMGDVKDVVPDLHADAVVLDIPDPWIPIRSISRCLKPGGRFCAYVPNANQVESTVRELRAAGFVEVYALENLQREMEVHEGGIRPSFEMLGHTGYLVFGRVSNMERPE